MRAWTAGCLALALLAAVVFAHDALSAAAHAWAPHLEWQASTAWRQPWRAFSAVLVHRDFTHLAANLAGCAVLGWFGWAGRVTARAALAAAVALPVTHQLLLLAPDTERYAGLSGALHAAVAVVALALWQRGSRRERRIAAAVWAGLVLKVLLEMPWRGAVQSLPGWDFPVAVGAHAAGLLSGTLIMALVGTTMPVISAPATRLDEETQR